MAAAIRRALREETGGVLAFLPGVAEIERTAERLDALPDGIVLHRLHGSLDPAAQRAAIAPEPRAAQGRAGDVDRRDQPDARRHFGGGRFGARAPPALRPRGGDDAAGHRAREPGGGRRSAPAAPRARGRGWPIACGRKPRPRACRASIRPRSSRPTCRRWCSTARIVGRRRSARRWRWLDPPPDAAVAEARARLAALGAIDARRPPDRARPRDRAAADAAAARAYAGARGGDGAGDGWRPRSRCCSASAGWAAPRSISRRASRRWRGERGPAGRSGSQRLAETVGRARSSPALQGGAGVGAAYVGRRAAHPSPRAPPRPAPDPSLQREGRCRASPSRSPSPIASPAAATHRAKPGRRSAGAGSGSIRPSSLATRRMARGRRNAGHRRRARASCPRRRSTRRRSRRCSPTASRRGARVAFDPATGAVEAVRERRLGAIRLSRGPDANADPAAIAAALLEGVRDAWARAAALGRGRTRAARPRRLRARMAARRSLDDATLTRPRSTNGSRRCSPASAGSSRSPTPALAEALRGLIGWDAMRDDRPARPDATSTSPAGSSATRSTMPRRAARASSCARRRCSASPTHPTVGGRRACRWCSA